MDQHGTMYWITHGVGITTLLGALWGAVPVVGAIIAIVWYVIQIRESHSFRKWAQRRHNKRIAKLEARLAYLQSLRSSQRNSEPRASGREDVDAGQ